MRKVRPKQGVPAVLRYETKPGVQAQVDWGELGKVEVDGISRKLSCFSMILGYSRMRYVEFTYSIDIPTLIQCHLNAFEYFGGYTQEILYDNMKQVVIKRALRSSDSQWNSQFEVSSTIMASSRDYADHTDLRQKGKLRTQSDTSRETSSLEEGSVPLRI